MPDVTVAVDAMGGDRAPEVVVEGALQAARARGIGVVLAGPTDVVQEQIARHGGAAGLAVAVADAPDVIGMGEPPLAAFRRKPGASIRVAAGLVARGEAGALFSAGHTGATFLAAHAALGLVPGVDRPALAVTFPTRTGAAVLLDAGANPDCQAEHLAQFAVMGVTFARASLNIDQPRVGLLSIGEEAGKGNDLIRDAHARLQALPIDYLGNLEARDLFSGRADVVVCDGFTGNIALKVGEGLVDAIEGMLREELGAEIVSQIGALLTRRAFQRFKQRVDYAEQGGAPLLGINGLVVVGHGRSTAQAVENGIGMAAELAGRGMAMRLAAAFAG